MEFFEKLSDRVEALWAARRWDREAFSDAATEALRELPPSQHLTPFDIARWFHESGTSVPQINLEATFGEPPVTVAHRDRFYIEALYWLDGTTTLHQHAFSGAFHVLAGSSIHASYGFQRDEGMTERLLLGGIQLGEAELLRRGDTRAIRFGSALIHALFHLERPSVTIVVRSKREFHVGGVPQYNYYLPRLAFDPANWSETAARKLGLLKRLHTGKRPEFTPALRGILRTADADTFALIAVELGALLSPSDRAMVSELATGVGSPFAAQLEPVMNERSRLRNIVARRRDIPHPDHRFFLALLLNVPTTERILKLVHARFPTERPEAMIARWLGDLSRTPVPDPTQINAIGLSTTDQGDLDPASLTIIEAWLEGLPTAAIARRVRERTGDELEDTDVADFVAQLSESTLLSPLFRREAPAHPPA